MTANSASLANAGSELLDSSNTTVAAKKGAMALYALYQQDPQMYNDILSKLAAMDFVSAIRVVATAAGMPDWAFNSVALTMWL